MTRKEILDKAAECVLKDRQSTYDTPENSFQVIADYWNVYLQTCLKPHQVAVMMALVKIARLKTSPQHEDNWIDLAGYAACGGEVATKENAK